MPFQKSPLPKAPSNQAHTNSRSLMIANEARTAKVEERRRKVATFLAAGYRPSEIAEMLGVSIFTIQRDVERIDVLLQMDAIPALMTRIQRSVLVRRQVQQKAWYVHNQAEFKNQNKISALSVVLQAQDGIDKLEGTTAPDSLNATATAGLFEVMMDVAGMVGGQDMKTLVAAELARRLHGSSASVVAGAIEAPIADFRKKSRPVIDADESDDILQADDAEDETDELIEEDAPFEE